MKSKNGQRGRFAEAFRMSWIRYIRTFYFYAYPIGVALFALFLFNARMNPSSGAALEYSWFAAFLPILALWHVFERAAVRKLSQISYGLIFKYDLWFTLEHGISATDDDSLYGKVLSRILNTPNKSMPLLNRIWSYAGQPAALAIGPHIGGYAALEKNGNIEWPSDPIQILDLVWNRDKNWAKTLAICFHAYIYIFIGVSGFSLLTGDKYGTGDIAGQMVIFYLAIMAGGVLLGKRIGSISFVAAYYKMLTDKWPWEPLNISSESGSASA